MRCDMTSVANYVIVEGDTTLATLGDGDAVYTKTFATPDYSGGDAVLSVMVQGLTAATDSVEVEVNNLKIGDIFPYRYSAESDREEVSTHQFTQTMIIGANVLSAVSTNTLRITAVEFPEKEPGNELDNFGVRDIIVFYKVEL
jgi:hypothetical protein